MILMKRSEWWAHPAEPGILVTSFLDFSFRTTQTTWEQRRGEEIWQLKTLCPKHTSTMLCSWLIRLFYKVVLRCINPLQNAFPKSIITSVANVSHFKKEKWLIRQSYEEGKFFLGRFTYKRKYNTEINLFSIII